MNKKVVIGISTIFTILVLIQTSTVFGAKPEKIYFFSNFDHYEIDEINSIYKDGQLAILQVSIHGTIGGNIDGDFVALETFIYHYDKDENLKYRTYTQELTFNTGDGILYIEAKTKIIQGVPSYFQKSGSWTIIDGTDMYEGTKGGGEYVFPFNYYGTIR